MSLNVVAANGQETVVDPAKVTREEAVKYLQKARKRELEDNSYFPILNSTPTTVIYTLQNAGVSIVNRPLVMQAKKARGAQIEGNDYRKGGKLIRHHAMKAAEILEAIDKLESPDTVVQETNRTKTIKANGETETVNLNDTFAFFITLENGDECVVVIEPNAEIAPKYLIEDDAGYEYHTTVTVFKPDKSREGFEFDYLEYLTNNEDNFEIEIKKESANLKTVIGGTPATDSATELSNGSIPQSTPKVNSKFSLPMYPTLPDAAEVEVELNERDWGFEWTDEALRKNIKTVRAYIEKHYPDASISIEIDNGSRQILVTNVARYVDFEEMKIDGELHDFLASLGVKEEQIGQHLSLFRKVEDKMAVSKRLRNKSFFHSMLRRTLNPSEKKLALFPDIALAKYV